MTKQSNDPPDGRRLRPGAGTDRIASALARFSAGTSHDNDLLSEVEEIIRYRSRRSKFIPLSLLGEPAWDILLELLRAELLGRPVTLSRLGVAARLPRTVASRWIQLLVGSGMCRCDAEPDKGHVSLTPEGAARLRNYFAESPQPFGRRP